MPFPFCELEAKHLNLLIVPPLSPHLILPTRIPFHFYFFLLNSKEEASLFLYKTNPLAYLLTSPFQLPLGLLCVSSSLFSFPLAPLT